jgi:hypothetical protein
VGPGEKKLKLKKANCPMQLALNRRKADEEISSQRCHKDIATMMPRRVSVPQVVFLSGFLKERRTSNLPV